MTWMTTVTPTLRPEREAKNALTGSMNSTYDIGVVPPESYAPGTNGARSDRWSLEAGGLLRASSAAGLEAVLMLMTP